MFYVIINKSYRTQNLSQSYVFSGVNKKKKTLQNINIYMTIKHFPDLTSAARNIQSPNGDLVLPCLSRFLLPSRQLLIGYPLQRFCFVYLNSQHQ